MSGREVAGVVCDARGCCTAAALPARGWLSSDDLDLCPAHVAVAARSASAPAPTPRGPLAPCGTSAAYRRHIRAGEEPCDPCKRAARARRREDAEAQRAQEISAAAPLIEFEGDVAIITASVEDARAIAAAALDRALVLEKVAGSTAQAVDQRAKGAMLRLVHKQIATHVRSAA